MLELPECYTIANQMREKLVGKIVSRVIVKQSPHKFAWYWGNTEEYESMLEGKKVTGASSFGGVVQLELEDMCVMMHDGSYPRYYENSKGYPKKSQLLIEFDDQTGVYISVQMYGGMGVFQEGTCEDAFYLTSKNKSTPLDTAFTYEYFRQLLQSSINRKKLTAKAFLATEQRIPGLGNGILQDILYQAGIDPRCDMATLSEEEFASLYHAVCDSTKQMCEQGGRDTERDLLGNPGGYQTWLSKKTVWTPCMKCGYEIHKANYMGGTIYYCEHCQRI